MISTHERSEFGQTLQPQPEGYEFVALPADGAPASDPIKLSEDAASLPTEENGFCNVVAVGEDRFVVSFAIQAALAGVEPGLYVAYVTLLD